MLKEIVNERLHSIEFKSEAQPSKEANAEADEFAAELSTLLGGNTPLHAELLQELNMMLALAQPANFSTTDIREALDAFDQGKGLLRALKVYSPGTAWQEAAKKLLDNMGSYTELAVTAKSTFTSLNSLHTRFRPEKLLQAAAGSEDAEAQPGPEDSLDSLVAAMSVGMSVQDVKAAVEQRYTNDWQVVVAAARQFAPLAQSCRESVGCNRTVEKELGMPIANILSSLLGIVTIHFFMPAVCLWTCGMAVLHKEFNSRKLTKAFLTKNPEIKEKKMLDELRGFSLKCMKEARRLKFV